MINVFMLSVVSVLGGADAGERIWKDLTRDIYVDGRSASGARSYYNRNYGYAIVLDGARDLVLIERGDGYGVTLVDKSKFKFSPDGLEIRDFSDWKGRVVGNARVVDGKHLLFQAMGKSFLVARHEGVSGTLKQEELWAIVPSWKALKGRYEPETEVVKTLGKVNDRINLKVIFGTWCGDSKNYVPKLLKTLELADNDKISVELIALSSEFLEPWDRIRDYQVTNVPTIIAFSEGRELGRLVERAQSDSMEQDLAEVLSGAFMARDGDDPNGEPIASGSWNHKALDGVLVGSEHWHLYKREESYSVYSRVVKGEGVFDIWAITDLDKHLQFLEITETLPGQTSRARYSIGEKWVSVTSRGGNRGIIRQKFGFRGHLIPETPSAMINGWVAGSVMDDENDRLVTEPLIARIKSVQAPVYEEQSLNSYTGRTLARKAIWADQTWWFHKVSGVPLRVETPEGEAELTYLQWANDKSASVGLAAE